MSARRFISNASWSLASQLVPLFVAVASIPLLLHAIGVERFGFLSIAWMLIGYAGLFDLGIRRAVTRVVAERLGAQDTAGAEVASRAAFFVALVLGLLLCGVIQLLTETLVTRWLALSPGLLEEARHSMRLLALSLPVVLLTNVYGGVLAGYQAFKRLSVVLMVMGVVNYALPLFVTLFSVRLEALVGMLVLARLGTNLMHRAACRRATGMTREWEVPTLAALRPLFRLGGWMSVSNFAGPLLGSIDRLILAGSVPVAALAHYTTPADMTSKLQTFPNSILSLLIPAMAGMQGDRQQLHASYGTSVRLSFAVALPIALLLVAMAEPLLRLWLGAEFASQSYRVLQWFAVGVFVYTVTQPASVLLLGAGNPKWIATIQLIELPLLLWIMVQLIDRFGIEGAAMAWAIRHLVEGAAVSWCAHRWVLHRRPPLARVALNVAVAASLLALAGVSRGDAVRLSFSGLALPVLMFFVWFCTMSDHDRTRIRPFVARLWNGAR